ncbi:hypothetical protein BDU57DRAFT_546120 [Ampelomyces quisqualis]|uniref:Uncharacterized protein n=1 Tax=Ampelomyces quisqualis TaxID=50730 RepID=A0A6A5QUS8_AMPQU|nr:hypothetical protein BDU57DRAFT_546120 [Ampelomyces quisqualis]
MSNMEPNNMPDALPTPRWLYIVPSERQAAQETPINNMMGSRRNPREVDASGPLRTPTQSSSAAERERHARSTKIFFSVLNNARRAHTFPTRLGDRREVSSPEAEAFYRSSSAYQAATLNPTHETDTHTHPTEARDLFPPPSPPADALSRSSSTYLPSAQRIPTPYPRSAGTTTRYSASVPMSASQRASLLHTHSHSPQHPPRRKYGQRRPYTPPPRLPATYRADTPFSYERPLTTTPFAVPGAATMAPGDAHFAAPRVDGVALELGSLQRATEGRSAVHRALWPEEREAMLREVDEVAMGLIRGAGRVRGVEEEQEQEEEGVVDSQQELKEVIEGQQGGDVVQEKKKRFAWLRRVWARLKKGRESCV